MSEMNTTNKPRRNSAEYLRRYRQLHPDKCKRWRDAYILRRADKLRAEAEAEATNKGGTDCGGD